MPDFKIFTNVPKEKIPPNFHSEMTKLIQDILDKPPSHIFVTIIPDQWMSVGSTFDYCATCYLMSVGKLGPEKNIEHSKAIFDKVCGDLGISRERMNIRFLDADPTVIGFDSTTVADILSKQ